MKIHTKIKQVFQKRLTHGHRLQKRIKNTDRDKVVEMDRSK